MTVRRAFPAIVLLIGAGAMSAVAARRAPADAPAPWRESPAWLVDLNSAAPAELGLLPRIGPTLAERIVEEREGGGPFATLEAVAERTRGIGPRTLERMAPFVRVGEDGRLR